MIALRNMSDRIGVISIVVAAVFIGSSAHGQCVFDVSQKMNASDGAANDRLGYSVAIAGGRAVVGAPWDTRGDLVQAGAVYVYTYDPGTGQWGNEVKLTASDAEEDDWFGFSVAIDGDLMVIGAVNQDADDGGNPIDKAGAAYVFRLENDQWVEKQMLTASIAGADEQLGWDVAVYNAGGDGEDLVVAGVPYGRDELETTKGYSVVFRSTDQGQQWTQDDVLGDPEGEAGDQFAFSVSVHGSVVVAGAPGLSLTPDDYDDGAVYVFRYEDSVWGEEQVLPGPSLSGFGHSVALNGDGDVMVVGCKAKGKAYVYRYEDSTWGDGVPLTPVDPETGDEFGYPVAIDGNLVLVGASTDDVEAENAGAVYCFGYDPDDEEWGQGWKLIASDAEAHDHFGSALAMNGEFAIVGVPNDDDGGTSSGSAHIYSLVMDDCHGNNIPDECECVEDFDENGVIDIDDLFAILAAWGPCDNCCEDLNNDDVVDIDDLFALLAAWGPCTNPGSGTPPQSIYDCWEYINDPQKFQTCIEAMTLIGAGP